MAHIENHHDDSPKKKWIFSMCGVLREASHTIWSNEHKRFVDVTGFSGLFNRLYTNTDIPFTVQQLL